MKRGKEAGRRKGADLTRKVGNRGGIAKGEKRENIGDRNARDAVLGKKSSERGKGNFLHLSYSRKPEGSKTVSSEGG